MAAPNYPANPIQPNNPTNQQRHWLTRLALAQKGRIDDYIYILNNMAPAPPITGIAPPGSFKNIKVGVIGGGLAGLSAAYELRKLGFEITLFEALEDRIGGRVYTYYFNEEKTLYGEYGPMRMPVSHETLWHYINLFGIDTRPFFQENDNAFIYLKNVRVRNDPLGKNVMEFIYPKYLLTDWEARTPWQQLSYYGFESPFLEATAFARSEILEVKPYYNPFIVFWDAISNRKILEAKGLSQGAINLLSSFNPLAGQNLYNSYLDYAQESYSVDLSYLYEIPGGIVRLPQAFYHALESHEAHKNFSGIEANLLGDVHIKRGYWVDGIYGDPEREKVTLAYQSKSSRAYSYETFDYVVCAIPFSTLRTVDIQPLFSGLKMQAIREVNYINAQKTFIAFKNRFWEQGDAQTRIVGGHSVTDLPISQIYYPSDHAGSYTQDWTTYFQSQPSCHMQTKTKDNVEAPQESNLRENELWREPGVLLATYNFSLEAVRLFNMPLEMRLNAILADVEKVHGLPPGSLNNSMTGAKTVNWNTETWFRGAMAYYTPQQKRLFSYASVSPEYDNHVFFAGEHVSGKHRWMQGALKSGMEAANSIARECMKKRRINPA